MTQLKIPKGAIVFQNDRSSLYSKAINLQTTLESGFTKRGRIGHVAIGLGDLMGQSLILEADNTIVDVNFADKYAGENHYLEVFNVSGHVDHRLVNAALKGTVDNYKLVGYGKSQILGFVLEFILRPLGIKRSPLGRGVICSELGFYYLQGLGYYSYTASMGDPNLITPTDLYDTCRDIFGEPALIKDYDSRGWRVDGLV